MKTFRINTFNFKLFFPTLFISVSAMSAGFDNLNRDKLFAYYRKNIQLTCTLPDYQLVNLFKSPSVPHAQAHCFVLDKSNPQDEKYILKPTADCSPEALHAKIKVAAQSQCPLAATAPAGSAPKPAAAKSPSLSGAETIATLAPVALAAANLADVRKKAAAAEAAAARKASSGTSSAAKPGSIENISSIGSSSVPGANSNAAINSANAVANSNVPTKLPVDTNGWTQTPNGMKIKTATDGDVSHATVTPKGYKEELIVADLPSGEKVSTPVYSALGGATLTQAEYQKGVTEEFQTPSQELAKGLPAEAQGAGAAVANVSPEPPLDEKGAADLATAEASDKEFEASLRADVTAGITEATNSLNTEIGTCNALLTGAFACGTAAKAKMTPTITALNKLQATVSTYSPAKTSCSGSAVRADNFCSMIRSPTAQAVGMLMTVGAAALSKMSSASETCGTTSNLSQLAQNGMLLANVACTGMKFMCDSSCASAQKILTGMMAEAKIAIIGAPSSTAKIQAALTKEQSAPTGVASKVTQCQKHAADIVQFTTQILGLATAAAQAKDCKEKLTAGGGTGPAGGGTVTMDQFCKDPAQASSLNCKCYANASAEGCPGAVVKATANKDGGPLVIKGGGNGSQLAGIDAFRQGSGLSAAAKTALGIGSGSAASTAAGDLNRPVDSMGGGVAAAANGSSGAGAGGLASGSSGNKDEKTKAEDKDKKFNLGSFGSLGSAIGGFFGGGSGSKKSSTGAKFGTEQQIAAAKRQIASDQLRSEISTASGRSNWDKVRTRYVESNSTFLGD